MGSSTTNTTTKNPSMASSIEKDNPSSTSATSNTTSTNTPSSSSPLFTLLPYHAISFFIHQHQTCTLQCMEGLALIQGFELLNFKSYPFTCQQLLVYTLHTGCQLQVTWQGDEGKKDKEQGLPKHDLGVTSSKLEGWPPSVSEKNDFIEEKNVALSSLSKRDWVHEVPFHWGDWIIALANLNACLHEKRTQVTNEHGKGPKVMIVGPPGSGKTTIAKTLVNYAFKSGHTPLFIDLCPDNPSISIPGTLAVMPITHPLDPSMGFLLSSITTVANSMGSPPWITWYGYETLSESSIPAFEKMVHKVAEICARKEQTDQATTTSGWILDVSGKVSWEVILTCCKVFQVDYLLVTAPLDTSSPSSIPWGVTHVQMPPNPFTSPVSLRKYQHIHKIKEYFYGIATQPKWYLSPHFTHLPVSLFTIQLQAPMSMTPSFSMTEVTDGNLLVHSVVAVMDDDEDRSVLGFVYVSEYNESKKRLSMLLPFPGKVPKKTLVLANIKWIELS